MQVSLTLCCQLIAQSFTFGSVRSFLKVLLLKGISCLFSTNFFWRLKQLFYKTWYISDKPRASGFVCSSKGSLAASLPSLSCLAPSSACRRWLWKALVAAVWAAGGDAAGATRGACAGTCTAQPKPNSKPLCLWGLLSHSQRWRSITSSSRI